MPGYCQTSVGLLALEAQTLYTHEFMLIIFIWVLKVLCLSQFMDREIQFMGKRELAAGSLSPLLSAVLDLTWATPL